MNTRSILVVASSPPPYGGQALMIQSLIDADLKSVRLYHVRMSFSSSMASVGKFEWKKLVHMVDVVWKAAIKRFRYRVDVLYYVPGGSGAVPVVRDIFILLFLRPLFRKTIFHFHAAGVSVVVETLPGLLRYAARRVYDNADLSIFLSERNPDHLYFRSRRRMVTPNGLRDEAAPFMPVHRHAQGSVSLLFVGVLQRSKGVMVLLEALRTLLHNGHTVHAVFVGEFASHEFQLEAMVFCQKYKLTEFVLFAGVKTGAEKWRYFVEADVFCFPSFFESESFGNVVVEAMMFGLPVVATHWRGIPDIVVDGETGFLVPVQESHSLALAVEKLVANPALRVWMGTNGRARYTREYPWHKFKDTLEAAFLEVANS